MRKIEKIIICVLFLFLSLTMPYSGFSSEQTTERPIYSAGDYWIFINFKGKLKKIEFIKEENNQYVFSKKKNIYSQEGTELIRDWELSNVKKKHHQGDPGPIIEFPLKVGYTWDYTYEKTKGKIFKKLATYTVESYEELTVTAGKFWAFKIKSLVEPINAPKGKAWQTETNYYWYSPDVKQIIKEQKQSGKYTELKEYNIK